MLVAVGVRDGALRRAAGIGPSLVLRPARCRPGCRHWHEPLAAARRAGWTLTYINAPHRFGVVSCPASEHSFSVDKTAKGSETKAKEALKKITWCSHPGNKVRADSDESQKLLDVADRIVAEVADGLEAAEAKRNAGEALDRVALQLETAASNVDAAVLLAAQEAALEAAIKVDDAPGPPVLAGKLDDAAVAVAGSELLARSVRVSYPGVAKPLLDQAESLRTCIRKMRSRLAALQEQDRRNSG